MKKFKRFCYRILPVALCAAMLGGCGASAASSSAAESIVSTDSAPLKVMASFYPMCLITERGINGVFTRCMILPRKSAAIK